MLVWLEAILMGALDKLGRKWKTLLGVSALALILISGQIGWLTEEQVQQWSNWALLLTGIGLYHKAAKNGGTA